MPASVTAVARKISQRDRSGTHLRLGTSWYWEYKRLLLPESIPKNGQNNYLLIHQVFHEFEQITKIWWKICGKRVENGRRGLESRVLPLWTT